MSQHDFNIANQSFPATRTDLNNALAALASNSSGDAEPGTTYANQWWYETDTNILKIRNEANSGWVDVITLDASMTATASELNQLDAITRGSILYGNASGATARLAAGAASTVLTSDGTDLSWAAAGGGGEFEAIVFPSDWSSPTATYTSSGTYSKGSLADDDYVWVYLVGGGGGGSKSAGDNIYPGGVGGRAMLIYAQAGVLDGASYVVGAGAAGKTSSTGTGYDQGSNPTVSSFTLTSGNGGNVFATSTSLYPSTATADLSGFMKTVLKTSSDVLATDVSITGTEITSVTFLGTFPSGYGSFFSGGNISNDSSGTVVFGGGSGAGKRNQQAIASTNNEARSDSTFAGNGAAATSSATGVAPGGGGTVGADGDNGGAGAAGSVRIYNV
jgi:hypothetical protein